MNKEELNKIIDFLLNFIGNDEYQLEIKDKCHFRGLILYLVNLERDFTGWCTNPNCGCQTKNIIKQYLEDETLSKFLKCYGRDFKQEILSLLDEKV